MELRDSGVERWGIQFSLQYHPLTRLVYGGDYVSFRGLSERLPQAAEHGEADFYIFQAMVGINYFWSSRFSSFLRLGYRRLTSRAEEDEHHRDETLEGLGDIKVGGEYRYSPFSWLRFRFWLGWSLPTGRTQSLTAAAFLDHSEAEALGVEVEHHSHLQLGTGTFDPFGGVEVLGLLYRELYGKGVFRVEYPFYSRGDGYRTAATFLGQFGLVWRRIDWRFSLLVEGLYQGRDRFSGEDIVGSKGVFSGSFGVPNTGRLEFALVVVWELVVGELDLFLGLRFPFYTRIAEDREGGMCSFRSG